jgi:uncharacterized membrane protein
MKDINKMELLISKFLRLGVIISGLIILSGWLMSFEADRNPFISLQSYQHFSLINSLEMNFILNNWGKVISYFGLMMLISLPTLRVFLSMILFIRHKEKMMAFLSLIVFIGLILSFLMGIDGK